MVAQLLLVGYLLVYIFEADAPWIVLAVLMVMVLAASWIALRTIPDFRGALYGYAFLAILTGGGLTVILITQVVLTLDPWYQPSFMVPLAGMIFAASMNSVSLAAERALAEMKRDVSYIDARRIALKAGLIPIVNSLLAVGLVSLPGLMTGQILSGVSPMIAVRYQVMVMCMIFGASGITAALCGAKRPDQIRETAGATGWRPTDEQLAQRKKDWKPREQNFRTGYLAKYAAMATSADTGAVLKWD